MPSALASLTDSSPLFSRTPVDAGELGRFLRARRESVDPGQAGLPSYGRRRTPGLRREEVAQLAGIGVTWYTWLEQGRPVQASVKALAAIAGALQCNEAETRHLFTLAGVGEQPPPPPPCQHLSPATEAILRQLDPLPAVIQSPRFDILGYNPAFERLMGVRVQEIPPGDRNCIYLALTHPVWRARIADWGEVMPRMVALFRAAMADHREDPQWQAQLARFLAVSPDFRETWQRYEVRGVENQVKCFNHPHAGPLRFNQTNWWAGPQHGSRLLVYVPADEASRLAWGAV